MKKLCAIMILGMISVGASAQSVRDKIEKAHKDSTNKEKAAKADVLLHKRRLTERETPFRDKIGRRPKIANQRFALRSSRKAEIRFRTTQVLL